MGANGGVEGVNGNVDGANGVHPLSMIIAQQLQNLLPAMLAQVSNRGNVGNKNGNVVNENIQENVGNVNHEMQKLESELWNHAMVRAGHAAYTNRFHELARLVPYLVIPESRMIGRYVYDLALQIHRMLTAIEPKTIQKVMQISGALTDEAVRNGSIKKVEKRGSVGEPSKDRSGRDDNKTTKTVNAFATSVNHVGRENTGMDWLSNYKAEIVYHEKVGITVELAISALKDNYVMAPVPSFSPQMDQNRLCSILLCVPDRNLECEIRYIPGKENVVADALSRKEIVKPKRVRAMNMIIQSSIKDRILAAQKEDVDDFAGLQKGCEDADKRRKPLEFSVGDYVLLKVSPWKGVVCFRKKGKLAPRFVGPFDIIEKVGLVAYRLYLTEELNGVHDTFYPVEILEREFKKLKRSRIAIVKIRWNSKRGPEFTWEREDQMKLKYPLLFSNVSS
ncbi:hypothetical protein Tco_0673175 [Tanacetum coccineum]